MFAAHYGGNLNIASFLLTKSSQEGCGRGHGRGYLIANIRLGNITRQRKM
jgi:hypothetical protein